MHVLWVTGGLGCDGDSISMTAATNPPLEDLLRGSLPGHAAARPLQPVLAFENGEEFLRTLVRGRRRPARSVPAGAGGLGPERGDQRRRALGGDGRRRRPAAGPDHRLDRPAGAARGGGARARHVRRLRRDPGDAQQPDRRDGPARLPRLELASRGSGSRSSTCPDALSSRTTSRRRCSRLGLHLAGSGRRWSSTSRAGRGRFFGRTVHERCDRAGFADQASSPTTTARAAASSSSAARSRRAAATCRSAAG